MSIKKGFTLAEVMITLGIIGIMAALLVPTITNTSPAMNKVLFKKAYSTIEKIVSSLSNDASNYPIKDQTFNDAYGNTLFKIFNNNTTTGQYGGHDKFAYLFLDQLNTVGPVILPNIGDGMDNNIATTTDGIVWSMYLPGGEFPTSSTDYSTKIIVDVNGPGKTPNCTADTLGANYGRSVCNAALVAGNPASVCSRNPDIFIIGVRYDGKLQVGTGANNDTCAVYILSNPTDNKK